MRIPAIAALLSSTALAFPTILDPAVALSKALALAQAASSEYLSVDHAFFDAESSRYRKKCVLMPVKEGEGFDDDNFLKAVDECGNGGIISLPAANYTINSPLQIELNDALLSVNGFISFTADIDNWVKKRVPLGFQNLALAWIITGSNYVLDGHGSGGIYGNGQVWYSWAKDEGNKWGRPMSFAIVNSTNVTVQNWSVIQPQFWASIIVSSQNVLYKHYTVNATQYDSGAKDHVLSWLQNTDGCDTYKSHNVTFDGASITTGDDCLAFKANSSAITVRNVTCYGGTGIAFGSIAQYLGRTDWLDDIDIKDVKLLPSRQHKMQNGLYFKSWIGYPIGEPPNGGGGGTGRSRNISISNVYMEDNLRPIFIQTDLLYFPERQGEGRDTGLFQWQNITFTNITGTSTSNRLVWLDCPSSTPCRDIKFNGFNVTPGRSDAKEINYVCNNVVLGGNDGLDSCHPSNSKKEPWLERPHKGDKVFTIQA